MIEIIFLVPSIIVIVAVFVCRFAIRRKPFSQLGWMAAGVSLVVAFYAPLAMGVWIPDFTGKSRVLGQAVDSTGQRLEVVQFWNHVDFYTIELVVTKADGTVTRKLIDGDSKKGWIALINVDESKRTASVMINGVGYPPVEMQ
jgi:hypothetical protein